MHPEKAAMACVRAPQKERFPCKAAASVVIVLQPNGSPAGFAGSQHTLAASCQHGDPIPCPHGWDAGATIPWVLPFPGQHLQHRPGISLLLISANPKVSEVSSGWCSLCSSWRDCTQRGTFIAFWGVSVCDKTKTCVTWNLLELLLFTTHNVTFSVHVSSELGFSAAPVHTQVVLTAEHGSLGFPAKMLVLAFWTYSINR